MKLPQTGYEKSNSVFSRSRDINVESGIKGRDAMRLGSVGDRPRGVPGANWACLCGPVDELRTGIREAAVETHELHV